MQQCGRDRPGKWGSGAGYGKGRGRGIANTRRWRRIIPGQRFEQGRGKGQASGIKGVPPRHDFSSPLQREKELSALEERLRALEEQKKQTDQQIAEIKEGRTKRPKAYVNTGKCTGCGICVDICPVGAIELREGKAIISDDCIACGQCVSECPSNAILTY